MKRIDTKTAPTRALAASAALALSLTCALGGTAFAETYTTTTTQAEEGYSTAIEQARARTEAAQDGYRQAKAAYVGDGTRAYALQLHANMLEDLVPIQQERGDEAARQLYKLQHDKFDVIEMLLESSSLDDFIAQTEYLNRVTNANIAEINKTNALIEQVGKERASVEKARAEAQERLDEAKAAVDEAQSDLEAVYAARVERQKLGIQRAQQEASGTGGGAEDSADGDVETADVSADIEALNDGADWNMTEEEFVNEWAPRLNAYLEGSALAGQGANFARSAWKYCIDPRWSAAISNIESGKGAICIRPHNAWGWGAADSDPYNLASEWDSWESAIDAHARGLAKGYGYTLTISGARAYCPPNWQRWYDVTLAQMAKI